jgi:hypothetical protein
MRHETKNTCQRKFSNLKFSYRFLDFIKVSRVAYLVDFDIYQLGFHKSEHQTTQEYS